MFPQVNPDPNTGYQMQQLWLIPHYFYDNKTNFPVWTQKFIDLSNFAPDGLVLAWQSLLTLGNPLHVLFGFEWIIQTSVPIKLN